MAHPYFTERARTAFERAGGDPRLAGPLAEWAEAARRRDDVHGVIVAQDGVILAETVRGRGGPAVATYVTGDRWELNGREEVGFASAAIARQYGQPVVHITRSDLTRGAGHQSPARVAASRHLLGVSQAELAELLGVNRHTVKAWESGQHVIRSGAAHDLERLVQEHADEANRLIEAARSGVPLELPTGPRPKGWYLGLASRVLDAVPDAAIEWAPEVGS